MNIYLDVNGRKLIQGETNKAPKDGLQFKFGDREDLRLWAGVTGVTGVSFAIKKAGDYEGDFLAYADLSATGNYYAGELNLNTVELTALVTGAKLPAMGEIKFGDISSLTFPVTVFNDVVKGTEGQPTPATPGFPTGEQLFLALEDIETLQSDIETLDSEALKDASQFATFEQGAKADTAVQPGDLATVATSGDYDDLTGTPAPSCWNRV